MAKGRENESMKILYVLFFIVGVCFCVVGIMGHATAWGASALSFFAATMVALKQKKNDKN